MFEQLLRYDKTKVYCLFDFETCNLNLNVASNPIWQVGMLLTKGEEIIREHNYLVKWQTKIECPPDVAAFNHYDKAKIDKFGRPPEEVFEVIHREFTEADILLGHNILGFDVPLIFDWYRLMGKDSSFITPKCLDTNCLAKGLKTNNIYKAGENITEYQYRLYHLRAKVKTRLKIMAEEFKIPFDDNLAHDAIYDLKINLAVWDKLKWLIEV